jgi:hypothetical protein
MLITVTRISDQESRLCPLNRAKELNTIDYPSPRQVQKSRDSTIDFDQYLALSRLSCACVGEGDSTVINSFVRLMGLKFSALFMKKIFPAYKVTFWSLYNLFLHFRKKRLKILKNVKILRITSAD